jgi:hypothetical protein
VSRLDRLARSGDNSPVDSSSTPNASDGMHEQGVSTDSDVVREGDLVRLRSHTIANRPAFQRWYADEEIARLLRHDQRPLNWIQSRGYFDTIIMPLSARGMCFAIHDAATDYLIGTTALTDIEGSDYRSERRRRVSSSKRRSVGLAWTKCGLRSFGTMSGRWLPTGESASGRPAATSNMSAVNVSSSMLSKWRLIALTTSFFRNRAELTT